MRKRFPALILSLAFLLCVPVHAAAPRLEVHLPESPVETGEEFTVTVDLIENPGILHIQFTLAFDRERMECMDIELGEALKTGEEQALSSLNPSGSGGAVLAAISLTPLTKDGSVGIFHFKAKENLSDFHFSIEKIYLGNDAIEKYDVAVTNAQPSGGAASGSTEPAPNVSDTTKGDNGTNVSNTPKSDSGTSASNTPKSDSGTSVSDTPKSDSGTSVSNTPKSDSGTSVSDTPKSGSGAGGTQTTPSNETASPPFTDIVGTWAENYIRTASERNLFQGYADGTFRPNNRLTRAQFMMVLWNLAGRPEASKDSPFTDMQGQIENFRKAVAWAYEKGFVNGTSATTFSPGEPLTRQAAMKILFAYHGGKRGVEMLTASAYDSIFTDSGKISAWAKDAMYWAVYQTILSGSTPSTLNPGGIVTRAQLAAIMVRYTDRFPA